MYFNLATSTPKKYGEGFLDSIYIFLLIMLGHLTENITVIYNNDENIKKMDKHI